MTIDSDTTMRGESDDLGERATPGVLLDRYAAGSSFFFASPRGSMLARGEDAVVPKATCSGGRDRLPGQVAEFLRHAEEFGRENPCLLYTSDAADE